MFKKNIFYILVFSILYNCPAFSGGFWSKGAEETYKEDDSLLGNSGSIQNKINLEKSDKIADNAIIVPPSKSFDYYIDQNDNYSDPVLSTDIINWIDNDILNPVAAHQSTIKNYVINGIGYYSGLSRGSLYFKLGYDLAGRIVHFSPAANITISSIYGLGVAAPMTILGLESSGDFIKNILKTKSIQEKEIELPSGKCIEISKNFIGKPSLAAISLISASTITYLTYYEFNGYIGWFWLVPGIPNLYTRAAMDYLAVPIVSRTLYNEIKRPIDRFIGEMSPESRKANLTFVRDKLEDAEDYISSFTNEQAEAFLDAFTKEKDLMTKIAMLTKPQSFQEVLNVQKRHTWGRKLLGVAGGAIGIAGLWIYLPATENAFNTLLSPICQKFGGECPLSLIDGLSYTALASATSIMSLASASSSVKFYDVITQSVSKCMYPSVESEENLGKKRCTSLKRGGAASVSALLAAWNASQTAEVGLSFLNMDLLSSKLALSASLLSFFSLSFWAVDEKFLKYLNSSDPRTPVLNKLSLIQNKIDDIADEHLLSLRNFLNEK